MWLKINEDGIWINLTYPNDFLGPARKEKDQISFNPVDIRWDKIPFDPARIRQDPIFLNNQKIINQDIIRWYLMLGIPIKVNEIIYFDKLPEPTFYYK